MMKQSLVLIVISLLASLAARSQGNKAHLKETEKRDGLLYWQGAPFTGMVYDYHDNGNQALEAFYVDGRIDSSLTQWHPNGNLWIQGSFNAGDTVGVYTVRYRNERKWIETEYNHQGQRHGKMIKWYSDGTKRAMWIYENGEKKELWRYLEGSMKKHKTY